MPSYFTEAEVTYRHLDDHEEAQPGERVFRYRWRHVPTGAAGERRIAVLEGHIDSLLLYWVNGDWIYKRVH